MAVGSSGRETELTESQFFESTVGSLGEVEVDKDNLKGQDGNVGEEIFPFDGAEADGIHKGSHETGDAAPKLEPGDSMRTLSKGPNLRQVR